MSTWTAYHNWSISPQEQTLYDHLLTHAEHETPQQLIKRFQTLFINGEGYPSRDVLAALDEIVLSKDVEHYFHHILNRCCHILINRWQTRPQLQFAVLNLIELLEQGPNCAVIEYSRSRQIRRLHAIVSEFTETQQYQTLKRLAQLISHAEDAGCRQDQPLGTLIRRYPYLYEHCLVGDDSPEEHQQNIRRIQVEAQHKFEVDLSQYITYRVRRARLRKLDVPADRLQSLRPVANPTLLSDRDLVASLNQFSGKIDNGRSYTDSAQLFLSQSHSTSFGGFKHDLYHYLVSAVEPSYGQKAFNRLLCQRLQQTLPQNENQPLNDFLLVRTCSQLLNFLIVDSHQRPQHFIFVDLINNLGPLRTIGLLLKLVLLCRKVKPSLEKRLSVLFNHYEAAAQNSVSWLVEILENFNIALSLTFGSVDIPAALMS